MGNKEVNVWVVAIMKDGCPSIRHVCANEKRADYLSDMYREDYPVIVAQYPLDQAMDVEHEKRCCPVCDQPLHRMPKDSKCKLRCNYCDLILGEAEADKLAKHRDFAEEGMYALDIVQAHLRNGFAEKADVLKEVDDAMEINPLGWEGM